MEKGSEKKKNTSYRKIITIFRKKKFIEKKGGEEGNQFVLGFCFGVLWMDGGFLGNWERRKSACEEGKNMVGIAYFVEGLGVLRNEMLRGWLGGEQRKLPDPTSQHKGIGVQHQQVHD